MSNNYLFGQLIKIINGVFRTKPRLKMENNFTIKGIEVLIKSQKFDGWEAWLKMSNNEWVRIDFMLEYYISGSVSITKKYSGSLNDEFYAKEYYGAFLDNYIDVLSNPNRFNNEEYQKWLKNTSEIRQAKKLLD